MTAYGFAVLLGLAVLLSLAGRGLLRACGVAIEAIESAGLRAILAGFAGLLAWDLLLQLLTLAHVPWSTGVLLAGLGLLIVVPRLRIRREGGRGSVGPAQATGSAEGAHTKEPRRGQPNPYRAGATVWGGGGWGDGVAALAVAVFGLLATTLWITTPDFIFHWGVKGERAFLARGIDWAWLAEAWNWSLHPDYPPLLPLLYGSTALLRRGFEAPTLQLWSVLWVAGIVIAARATFVQALVGRGAVQAGTAWVGLLAAAYSIGYLMAGGADGMIALAFAAALPALVSPIPDAPEAPELQDLQIGLAAAFAAASKMEGLPLAAFLVAVHLARRAGTGKIFRTLLRTAGPALAVVLPWFVETGRRHLFQAANSGPFDLARGRLILPAMVDAMNVPELHGLPWLVCLLPLPWLARRTRPLAAVATAQLAFYLWAYFASGLEPRFYVLSNFARLLFQLLPAILVGTVIAAVDLDAAAGRRQAAGGAQGEGEGRQQATG